MPILQALGVLVLSYLIGSIPFGLIIVYLTNGKDIRKVESGRTGGTNAMRAAGTFAGVFTAVFDFLKGASAVWLARALLPGTPWLDMLAPILAVIGHNYSVFLLEKGKDERVKLRGGAGGATCLGGAFGLWPVSLLIILPLGAAIWYGIGYASVTTISIGLLSVLLFGIRAITVQSPWIYILYGILSEVIMLWALRPNLVRLKNGTERLHGWRARRSKITASRNTQPLHKSKPA